MNWTPVSIQPPDKTLQVMDIHGNKGYGTPCYYDFNVVSAGPGKWNSKIIHCEPYFDGSWLIEAEGLQNPLQGSVVVYAEI